MIANEAEKKDVWKTLTSKDFDNLFTYGFGVPSVEGNKKSVLMTLFFRYALEELPLSERLTAEEKERVRKMYAEELGMARLFYSKAKASNDISCRQHYFGLREPYISRMKLLERIFGKEMFNEKEK